jgi:hypothetical protein
MKTGSTLWKLIVLAGLFLVSLGWIVLGSATQTAASPPNTGMADPDALIRCVRSICSRPLHCGWRAFPDHAADESARPDQ